MSSGDGPRPWTPDRWTTFSALLAAVLRVLRSHPRLLVFPVLILVVAVLASAAVIAPILLAAIAPRAGVFGTSFQFWVAFGGGIVWWILVWYGLWGALTFLGLALSRASLLALREEPFTIRGTLAFALGRPGAILGFALLASTVGAAVTGDDLQMSGWLRASMTAFGLLWTLLSIFAITTMAGEGRGPVAALRRSFSLLRARWAEGRLGPVGLGLVWVPFLALEIAMFGWTVKYGLEGIWPLAVALFLANVAAWAATWLFGRVYAAAVYCYVVEGVVPEPFRDERLANVWQVAGPDRPPSLRAPESAPSSLPRSSPGKRRGFVTFAGLLLAFGAGVGWRLHVSGVFRKLGLGDAVRVDGTNFKPGPSLHVRHEIRLTRAGLTGITAAQTAEGPRIFVFGDDRLFQLAPDLSVLRDLPLPAVAHSVEHVAALELAPGHGVLVGVAEPVINRRRDAVTAFDWNGRLIFQRTADTGDAVHSLAPVRIGNDWGVAAGYNGFYGLCFINSRGDEKWCNRDIGNVWVASATDCDGDGVEDILSLSGADIGSKLGCYDVGTGQEIAHIAVPHSPSLMRTVDLDGDRRKEIAFLDGTLRDTHRFGAWHADGSPWVEVHASDVTGDLPQLPDELSKQLGGHRYRWLTRTPPLAARRAKDGLRDVVVIGPRGELLGVSPTGERWMAGEKMEDAVAIDLDGDGAEEIVALGKRVWEYPVATHVMTVWSWSERKEPVIQRVSTFARLSPRHPSRVPAAVFPIRPYGAPVGELGPSDEEVDYRHGCYTGVDVALAALPAIVQPDPPRRHLEDCETALRALDVSRYDKDYDLTVPGCWQGVSNVFAHYQVSREPDEINAFAGACLFQTRRPGTNAAPQGDDEPFRAKATTDRTEPVFLPAKVVESLRLDARGKVTAFTLPAAFPRTGRGYGASFDVCVSEVGKLISAGTRFGSKVEELDEHWLNEIRASTWRPYSVHGTPLPFCARIGTFLRASAPAPAAATVRK